MTEVNTQEQQLKHRLTPLDALFFYFEKPEAPFNIGSTILLDGKISFEAFKTMIAAKLPLLPRYRQKIMPSLFAMGYPTWELDPKFDINQHIFHLQLEAPGTLEQLRKLSSKLQSTVLPRNKPLWEIYVIDGLEGERTALVTKVHHAMSDGISGVDLMKIVFDTTPNPPPIPPTLHSKLTAPPRSKTLLESFVDEWFDAAELAVQSWGNLQQGIISTVQGLIDHPDPIIKSYMTNLLPLFTEPVSMLPFNRVNSGQEELAWAEFNFSEVRRLKKFLGGTLNDVVLTVLSGAISYYLAAKGEPLAGRTLRLMVPVSLRQEEQHGMLGNLISLLPVEVPLDLADPLARHEFIVKKTNELKGTKVAEEVSLLLTLLGIVPASLQTLLGPVTNTLIPLFNVVCTNVPGPNFPLYVLGKHVTHSYPYVPTAYAVGLSVAIFSYEDKLLFGFTADANAMPDVSQLLSPFLGQAFTELETAAKVQTELATLLPKLEALEKTTLQSPSVSLAHEVTPLVEETALTITPETGAPWPTTGRIEQPPASSDAKATAEPVKKTIETSIKASTEAPIETPIEAPVEVGVS